MRKVDGDGVSTTAVVDAILAGDSSRVRQLLAETDVNGRIAADRMVESIPHWLYAGDVPLHVAAVALQESIVQILIDAGANPNAVNRRGAAPLHYVSDLRPRSEGLWNPERQAKIIGLLVAAGADVDLADRGGATPLHRAVRARGLPAVVALLEHGASVSVALRPGGSTPLHLAVSGSGASATAGTAAEQLAVVDALLAHGADPLRPDARGRTPIAAAKSRDISAALSRKR